MPGGYVAPWVKQAAEQPDPGYKPLGEKGGQEYDEKAYIKASLRADLCELIGGIDYRHSAKIADAILAQYDIKRKFFKTVEPTKAPDTKESTV